MTMPHMSGEEVFREMRTIQPGVKVILSSGYNEQETISQFQGKGLAGFIREGIQVGRDRLYMFDSSLGSPMLPLATGGKSWSLKTKEGIAEDRDREWILRLVRDTGCQRGIERSPERNRF
jgi:hypothetical protein